MEKNPESQHQQRIRSFVKRKGRITKNQKESLKTLFDVWGMPYKSQVIDLFSIFNNHSPIILEIGFGMGKSLVDMAVASPEFNFIGIEIHEAGVGACLSAIDKAGIDNVRIIQHDAIEVLLNMIPDNSIARLQLFFPDPWHKKRHHKRRIVQSDFLALVYQKLILSGRLHIATDWLPYAEDIVKKLVEFGRFHCVDEANSFITTKPDYRNLTKFELRGLKLGHIVTDIVALK